MTHYNRFDPNKKWVSVDINGGRRIQSAELNEMQSIALHRDKQIGDIIFGAGHVIEGGELYINRDKTELRITPARVYLDGIVHDIPDTTLPITGVGEANVGLKVTMTVVTFEDDPDLLDPAVAHSNFGMPGADRTITIPNWYVNDPAATTMYRLIDGELVTAKVPPELEGFTPVLARRTYDTSGSFLVSGMDGYIEPKDESSVNLVVDAGKAYVLGYELSRLVPTRIEVPKALEYRTVVNETKTYNSGTSFYPLNSNPVKQITQITATVRRTDTITRGNIGGTADVLPLTPVVNVVEVKQGGTTYSKGTDYQQSGDSIDWSLAGAEPAGGTSYTVTYDYTKVIVLGTDAKLENDGVQWLSGDKPVSGTQFQTTYDFYLSRKDVYYIDARNEIKVIQGQPSVTAFAPTSPPDVLELGELYLPPNSDQVVVTNRKPKRLTMLELRSLLERLERAEYNQAIQSLDTAAQLSDPSLTKKGIFTDNFTNFERTDIGHPDFDAMINPADKVLQLPIDGNFFDLEVDTAGTTARVHERLVTSPYTEEILIDQSFTTQTMNLNPYMVFGNIATIRLTPSSDTWIEQQTITKNVYGWWDDWRKVGTTKTTTAILLDEAIPFIRQREVIVNGEAFEPMSNNITATFDGVTVPLIPMGTTVAGSAPGTIKADGLGKFQCKFMIPPNIRSGTREVYFYNEV
ncbi:DUF4815 domain-containing protein [Brevibacillus sp. 1238]|uniref:DUF4815 domain-containing protein n=1 Tax=Brevibacillus sp. 1238 TaxID=2940565 RepID=UPI0024733CB1|nr:DUF4815 domain-containing protein [Brevibacillus sp. 1238]MDH6351939.1 hypothetical protein [Brevibacillus sp. 1238]